MKNKMILTETEKRDSGIVNVINIFDKFKKLDKLNTSYPINPSDWSAFKVNHPLPINEKDICIYIHIPFCEHLCKFCEYIRFKKQEKYLENEYIHILNNDINQFIKSNPSKNIYGLDIGGGTPTALSIDNFKLFLRGLSKIYDTYNIMSEFEPSIEATFNTIKEDYLEEIVLSGFQRISFGLQTNNKKLLNDLNRENSTLRHTENTINLCRNKGIKKINIDLMYGLPNLTTKDIINSIDIIKYLMPEHIALYEFRTNILHLSENFNKIELYRQYELFYNGLIKLGYKGNFGQNTFSLYDDLGLSSYLKNRTINNMSYKGFGISAQSKSEAGISYNIGKNKESFDICCKNKTFYEVDTYFLPKDELLSKYIAISGYYGFFYISTANKIINDNFLEIFNKEIEFLINQKYIEIKNDKINITRNGFLYYGAILALFYSTNTKNKLIK